MPHIQYTDAARVGRDLQRRTLTGKRIVTACVPIAGNKVVLVSRCVSACSMAVAANDARSRVQGVWIIPKGGWESDEEAEAAAMREAWEEAGVQGDAATLLFEEELENTHYMFYFMRVTNIADAYPEADRQRRIVRALIAVYDLRGQADAHGAQVELSEVPALCKRPEMLRAIRMAAEQAGLQPTW